LIGSEFGDSEMKTVTLEVATLKDVKRRAQKAFKGRKQGARISFATPELLFRLMTAKRWELIRMMTGAGPLTNREAARRVDRDVKGVHGDVHTLLNAGILRKTEESLIIFPYDAIHVNVDLIERHIQLIASQLVKNGIKPIIQSTLFVQGNSDLNAKIRALDDDLRQWAAESKITFIDLNEVLSSNGSLRADVSDDGVHLNSNGCVLWRDAIRRYIDDASRHL
jgi:predicted transcriptional regulator